MLSSPREISPRRVSQCPYLCTTVDHGKGEGEAATARTLSPPALADHPTFALQMQTVPGPPQWSHSMGWGNLHPEGQSEFAKDFCAA